MDGRINIPRMHVTNLLKRQHNDGVLKFLPMDWRALMFQTSDKVILTDIPSGVYHHFAVEPSLCAILEDMEEKHSSMRTDFSFRQSLKGQHRKKKQPLVDHRGYYY